MVRFNDSLDDSKADELQEQKVMEEQLDALDALESPEPLLGEKKHLVAAHVFEGGDKIIAQHRSVEYSRLDEGKDYPWDAVKHIMKGDAGEGYTYVRLLERYERDQIVSQPEMFDGSGRKTRPDFAVRSNDIPNMYQEIVDAKAWSLLRPTDASGEKIPAEDFMHSLLDHPNPDRLVNTSELQSVVDRYSSSPQLEPDGRVVLYIPEDTFRYAPQIVQEVKSWSGSELAHGRAVELRSMGVWNSDLWAAAGKRR